MGKIIIGLIGIVIGFMAIWKSEWLLQNFGRIDWAEEKLGSDGGTRMFYKLFGLGLILLSFLFMFGFVEGILTAIFLPNKKG